MAGNSWQQPVAGEPSVGTLHLITPTTVYSTTSTASSYTVIDVSTWIPMGATTVYGSIRTEGIEQGTTHALGRTTAYTTEAYLYTEVVETSGGDSVAYGFIPVAAARTLVRRFSNSSLTDARFTLMGYTL